MADIWLIDFLGPGSGEGTRWLSGDLSLNTFVSGEAGSMEWEDTLIDEKPDPETLLAEHDELVRREKAVRAALNVLTSRERRVLEARRLVEHPPTLDQLGREMLISSERVRQLEMRAFAKIRQAAWQHLDAEPADVLIGNVGDTAPTRLRNRTSTEVQLKRRRMS